MREEYENVIIAITAFDEEDVIATSGIVPDNPVNPEDGIIVDHGDDPPFGSWF